MMRTSGLSLIIRSSYVYLCLHSNPVEIERKLGEIRQLRRRIRKRVKELEAKEVAHLAAKVDVCKGDAARMHQVVLDN